MAVGSRVSLRVPGPAPPGSARLVHIGGVNMIKGTHGEWYQDNHIGGYFNQFGELVVCEEYDLADLDTDKYAVDVQNCDGYYNEYGKYVSFEKE